MKQIPSATSAAIQRNFTIEDIVNEIRDKSKQLPSIVFSLKEILSSEDIYFEDKEHIKEIYFELQMMLHTVMAETQKNQSAEKQKVEPSELPTHEQALERELA